MSACFTFKCDSACNKTRRSPGAKFLRGIFLVHRKRAFSMHRNPFASIIAIALALASFLTPARAGGWSVAMLDDWPAQVIANQPFTISFSLRQHGLHLISFRGGSVEFEDEGRPGQAPLRFDVQPEEGRHRATITLPDAGTWRWRINAFGGHPMPPLTVYAAAPPVSADPPDGAAIGRVLFVAKGCSTCHIHPSVPGGYAIGPMLKNGLFTAEYLHSWLADPTVVKPGTRMPNLGLKLSEIEALTAFLTAE
jgi:cytochrome c2